MPSLKDIIDAMNSSWPVALAICLSCLGVLGAYSYYPEYIGGLPSSTKSVVFLGAIFSGSIVLVRIVQVILGMIAFPYRFWRRKRAQAQHVRQLWDLPNDERWVLAWAVASNKQVILANFTDARLAPLVSKDFLYRLPGNHSILDWPHKVPDHIWKELQRYHRKHPFQVDTTVDPFGSRYRF